MNPRRRNGSSMRSVLTTIRCIPRLGYNYTDVRTIELALATGSSEAEAHDALASWFADRGMPEAVYDLNLDDEGFCAVINDETYQHEWGAPLL